tara:strand:+ start:4062 stop:5405 length:1344 start_codon:yes stop_codon:yes gene_type:complete
MGFDQANVHKRIQAHLGNYDNNYQELPRGIGKTSQMIARCAWEIGRNPSVRIKYIQQSDKDATRTTQLVKQIIESEKYRLIFPHVLPEPDLWGKQEFRVKTESVQRDATMEAKGIFGRAGGRADILIADDVCDLRNSIQQPALREQVKEFWSNNWLPMRDFTNGKEPRTWKIGTCYHVDDITSDWRDQHELDGSLLRLPAVGFVSPWPEEMTEDRMQEIRKEIGPIAYGRAYELMPITAEMVIYSGDWIISALYDDEQKLTGETIASFDFAFSEKRVGGDPDYSVCLIGKLCSNNHLYLLDMIRVRTTFPEFTRRALALCDKHVVARAIGEANGPQKGLVQQLNEEANFPIMGAKRDQDKVTRAAATQAFVESGRLHLPSENTTKPRRDFMPLYDEMTTFPISAHDDTVDAVVDLMTVASVMRRPESPRRIANTQKANNKKLNKIYR